MSDSNTGGEPSAKELGTAIVVTFFLCLTAFLLYGHEHYNQQADARETNYENAVALCASAADGVADPICVAERLDAEAEQKRSEYDLQAQQDMSKWALLLLIVTSVGVIYIAMTLDATRAAVKEAENATAAGVVTARKARLIGQAQARAYIGVESAEYEILPDFLYMTLVLRNYGNSPATSCHAQAVLDITKYEPSKEVEGNAFSKSLALRPNIEYQRTISTGEFSPVGSIVSRGDGDCRLVFERARRVLLTSPATEALDDFCNGRAIGSFMINLKWKDVFGDTTEAHAILWDKPKDVSEGLAGALAKANRKPLVSRALILDKTGPKNDDAGE